MTLYFWPLVTLILFLIFGLARNRQKYNKMNKSLLPLTDISTDLIGSSEQIMNVSRDLKNASIEQRDTLISTVSISHEINAMMNRTNDNTKNLEFESTHLDEMTLKGTKIVKEMVEAGFEMKTGSEHFKNEMKKNMDELCIALNIIKEISNKTKLINDIVFQTKLLSFNASVEAARAGESGKGFSVVAEEIGKLAKMSGHISDEISKIVDLSIASVNESINNAKFKVDDLIEETVKKNESSYQSTISCETVFNEIADKMSKINETIKEISLATKEQSIGINQLDSAIIKLQEVADRNTLVASQSTEHAKEFEIQTQNLSKLNQNIININSQNKNQIPHFQKFIWNDKLCLGVKVMDDEHKVLIDKINIFIEVLEQQYHKKDTESLYQVFTNLAEFTIVHFAHEENYMKSIKYPQLTSHQKIHENLLNQVGVYGEQIKNETLDDKKISSFLRNWLLSHIMGVDMQYAHSLELSVHKKSA